MLLLSFVLAGASAFWCATGAPTPVPRFQDVTATSGIFDAGVERGLAIADYDFDGDLDLFFSVLRGPDLLFRNDGAWSFREVRAESGLPEGRNSIAPTWIDDDGDGDLDLYIAGVGPNLLYRNEGAGNFAAEATEAAGTGLTWGVWPADFDADGSVDLYLCEQNSGDRLFRNDGGGYVDATPEAMAVLDADGTSAAWGDYDGDGDLDVHVSEKRVSNRLLRNDGLGNFSNVTHEAGILAESSCIGSAWADFDQDGDLDLYVSRDHEPNFLFRNTGDGAFEEIGALAGVAHPGSGRGVAWADFDRDGDLDLYLCVSDGPNELYRNEGELPFTPVAAQAGLDDAGTGTTIVWADLDRDGDLDLVLSNAATPLRVFENRLDAPTHWVGLRLRTGSFGTSGARVEVQVGGCTSLLEDIRGGGGYQSQGPDELYFGLGEETRVEAVRVRFRDRVLEFHDVEIDRWQSLDLERSRRSPRSRTQRVRVGEEGGDASRMPEQRP